LRYDLHHGYLTLDLVALGPYLGEAISYLTKYFGQATERDIQIEIIGTHSVDDAINVFGNLLSSAVIYDDARACQAFLEGLEGSRMVQGRGRFRRLPKVEQDAPANVSNINHENILEINADPKDAGRPTPLVKCPECGGTKTVYKGRLPGDWRKVRSATTGQWYWRLEKPMDAYG
jgi:hypothetical protein